MLFLYVRRLLLLIIQHNTYFLLSTNSYMFPLCEAIFRPCIKKYSVQLYNTVKPRFTNASDHGQFGSRTNFSNTKRLGWLLCLELRTRKPSTSWSDKLGVSASAVFVEEWSSGKYRESATPISESVSCCVAFVHSNSLCLLLNFSVFCVFLK